MAINPIPAILRPLTALAKAQKTLAVRDRRAEGVMLHLLDFERAGCRVIRCGWSDADGLVAALHVGIPQLAADTVFLAVDTYGVQGKNGSGLTNPITGKEWRLGDMDEIAEMDLGVERGLLVEGLNIICFERSGIWTVVSLAYTHDRVRRCLQWDEPHVWDGAVSDRRAREADITARLPNVARQAFAQPTAVSTLTGLRPNVDSELLADCQRKLDIDFAQEVGRQGGKLLEAIHL